MWVFQVTTYIAWLLGLIALGVHVFAFVDCLTRRADAFPAVGKWPKSGWLLILGLAIVITIVLRSPTGILGLIALVASLVYLVDVRPAVRGIARGGSGW